MRYSIRTTLALVALAAGLMVFAGCAKKAPVIPPAPPQPPAETTPTPQPTKPAEETPPAPAPSELKSEDFKPAFFDLDSYSLKDEARAALDQDARLLRDKPTATITIEGHCDERGTAEYNQALGERRAQAARDYLVAAGIADSRVQIISYGKERPFDLGHDENAWASNRRAHIVLR